VMWNTAVDTTLAAVMLRHSKFYSTNLDRAVV